MVKCITTILIKLIFSTFLSLSLSSCLFFPVYLCLTPCLLLSLSLFISLAPSFLHHLADPVVKDTYWNQEKWPCFKQLYEITLISKNTARERDRYSSCLSALIFPCCTQCVCASGVFTCGSFNVIMSNKHLPMAELREVTTLQLEVSIGSRRNFKV